MKITTHMKRQNFGCHYTTYKYKTSQLVYNYTDVKKKHTYLMKLLIYKSAYINIKSAFARAMLLADLRKKHGPGIEVDPQ